MRFGDCEKGVFVYVVGLVPFIIIMIINKMVAGRTIVGGIPFYYNLLIFMGCFMTFMGLIWIVVAFRKNRLSPMNDKTDPDECTAVRVTKDGIVLPQFVKKGLFGVNKTLIFGEPADFIDTSEFPLRIVNGNPAIIVFDWNNTTMDLRRSVARKHWKRYVADGPSAYRLWKEKQDGKKTKG